MDVLCKALDDGNAVEDFLEFVELNLPQANGEDFILDEQGTGYEEFLRELEAMDNDDAHQVFGCGESDENSFKPEECDLMQLADSYLQQSVSVSSYCFVTGCHEDCLAEYMMERFERVANHLSDAKRRTVIDTVDHQKSLSTGDEWQVFKYVCRPGLWSTPANIDAILRVAESIPEQIPADQESQYGPEFLATLRAVRDAECAKKQTNWVEEGF
ncbi:hypothetical protein [Roseiconus lacunae]|uniref:hypothetical protein n=1 Tax=Roseiconus lacunae TaxID=2605694 RepID=UPI001E55EF92|nr:hypothetical protein [Roseiconus lacunae]MCD0459566.1 hypothetical protein [Roseiconus lacunae]